MTRILRHCKTVPTISDILLKENELLRSETEMTIRKVKTYIKDSIYDYISG